VTRPAVAVFGRNRATATELDAARRYGAAVARAGATLVTGGIGSGAPEIKEQAIEGALSVAGARWVGIENGARAAPPVRMRGGGVVLRPGVGHRRNFLLACLCDAAVALPGEQGTAAELLFALVLGRPVATVGRPVLSAAQLRVHAVERVPRPAAARTPLDLAITAAYDSEVPAAPVACHILDADATDVVRELLRDLQER
jgi:predicted Rossmann-fold nucleotide-binding protein